MRHRVSGRKLGRTSSHRIATLRNLSMALFTHERITTTLGKAKEMRPFAEKLITLSKQDSLAARRRVARHLRSKDTVKKLFETLGPRYAERPGGYTRLYHLGHRPGDAADTALVELVGALDGAGSTRSADTSAVSTAEVGKGAGTVVASVEGAEKGAEAGSLPVDADGDDEGDSGSGGRA